MNSFDLRLKNNLFPEMPASFSHSVHRAMKKVGVQPKTARPWTFAAAAVAVAAVAASLVLVLTSAHRHAGHEASPDGSPSIAAPITTARPDWNGTTTVLAALDPDGRFSAEDADAFARSILAFLYNCGESEPEELWILKMQRVHLTLAQDDTAVYAAPILVLAQSSFEGEDGPDLYCISAHTDVGVLWGTVGSAKYPNRVSVSTDGQLINVIYGTNAILGEPPLAHITRGAITDGDRSSDVEFSVCLSAADKQAAFGQSAHYDADRDYFLVQPADSSARSRMLELQTEDETYTLDLQTGVFEMQVTTAAEAALHRQELDRLAQQPHKTPKAAVETLNLTALSDEDAAHYLDAISEALRIMDVRTDTIWLCGCAPFAYAADAPGDEAYLLAQYAFDGETGPELFYLKNGTVVWMTQGYDPYNVNTVLDPLTDQYVTFGYSFCYDNGAISMREGRILMEDGDPLMFEAQLPLDEVQRRVGRDSPYFASAREAFLCIYPENRLMSSVETIAGDGRIFFSPDERRNDLGAVGIPRPTPSPTAISDR